jgi:zinc finger-like protein
MNQKELEAAIRRVSRDDTLEPQRKAYLMQNLMTSRWIVAQQKVAPSAASGGEGSQELRPSYHDEAKGVFGCEHYQRNCKVKAACCGQLVTCRFCHDKDSDHTMDRHAVQEMMCMTCLQVQPVAQFCATPSCNGRRMARYYCSVCKFFDDSGKDIYHCPFCNLCRVGQGLGIDFFHCMSCNACMSLSLSSHTCREKGLESNCPICHDFLFTSNTPVKALPCGHFMHSLCYQSYTHGHYTCPICSKSLGDMAVYFGMLDALLETEELPEEYKDQKQGILCNDCEQKGSASFHFVYHKCSHCGSYNTRTI